MWCDVFGWDAGILLILFDTPVVCILINNYMREDKQILCDYGCEQKGEHYFKRVKKWCCSKSSNSCPVRRKKNSEAKLGNNYASNRKSDFRFPLLSCSFCGKDVPKNNFNKHEAWCSGNSEKFLERTCKACSVSFRAYGKQKYCTVECYYSSLKARYASGELRPKSGRVSYYDYIRNDGTVVRVHGTYELQTCSILDKWLQNGIIASWEYESRRIPYNDENGVSRTYFPDFTVYTDEGFYLLEVKGYKTVRDDYKWEACKSLNIDHRVWYLSDIKSVSDNKD